jgi:peptidoglycan/LPS O-acetylase OafA/YrhL
MGSLLADTFFTHRASADTVLPDKSLSGKTVVPGGQVRAALHHRHDIDGLRAIAVLPVILFHLSIGPFSGGYVGVDIFFVISGFLITSIIARELENGSFSVMHFYERRIRRIYPAALAVILFTALVALLVLPPIPFAQFARSILFYNTYATNLLFRMESGYFDTASELKPLLHTWSLCVEEQFYIFFPVFLLATYRLFRRHVIAVVAIVAVVSFLLNCYAIYRSPVADFYLFPYRAWELALGALLAIWRPEILTRKMIAPCLTLLGLGLIAGSILLFDGDTLFPGMAAAAPCLGAVLIIGAGAGQQANIVNRLIGNPVLVYVGLISYSLYLWHWPIMVFARYLSYPEPIGVSTKVALLAGIWALSHLCWRYVETPFRVRSICRTPRSLFGFFAVTTALVFVLGGAGYFSKGFPSRVSPEARLLDRGARDNNPLRDKCHGGENRDIAVEDYCVYGAKSVAPTFALWGDSHGAELAAAIGSALGESNQSLKSFTFSFCPPTVNFAVDVRPSCIPHNTEVLEYLLRHDELRTIYLIANYHVYETPWYQSRFEAGFKQALIALAQAGRQVVVIHPLPASASPYPIPTMGAVLAMRGIDLDRMKTPRRSYDEVNASANRLLSENLNIPVLHVHPEDALCTSEVCEVFSQGSSLYFDNAHLSMFGARYVVSRLRQQLLLPVSTSGP